MAPYADLGCFSEVTLAQGVGNAFWGRAGPSGANVVGYHKRSPSISRIHPGECQHWEARLLAASTIVVIAGFDTFAIMDLANTALLRTAFSDVMLFATVISFALLVFSAIVMLIRVGFSALANRRQARIGDEV